MALSRDELFEILSWLPAKAIYKFMSTSKSFSKFPQETYFALKQSQKALLRDDTCFFIQPDITPLHHEIELHPLPGEELSSGVFHDVLAFLSNSAKIMSSTNGLILCHTKDQKHANLFIINPVTKSWCPILIPEHLQECVDADLKIGFECDSSDGCMMFLFSDNSDDWWSPYLDCKMYIPKEGLWKEREEKFFMGGRNLILDMPVHHHGAVHFISDCYPSLKKTSPYFRPYIMSYNMENGSSRMMRLPKDARKGSHERSCGMGIFKWGKVTDPNQSICLVRLRKRVFTVWILTQYELSLWKMVLKVRVKSMLKDKDPTQTKVKGFTVLNGNLLVFATENKVYGYGFTDTRIQEICVHGFESNFLHFTSYTDTLRTCGTRAETLPLPLNL